MQLVQILATKINPTHFGCSGGGIVWFDENGQQDENSIYKTPENLAIVSDVIANYAIYEAEYNLVLSKQEKIAEIVALSETKNTITYNGTEWPCDDLAQQNVSYRSSYAALSQTVPEAFPWTGIYTKWIDPTGSSVTFATALDFLIFAKAISDYCNLVFARTNELKVIVNSSTMEQINALDITVGWPSSIY